MAMKLREAAARFLYPPRCLCCREFVQEGEWTFLCPSCEQKIKPVPSPACTHCGSPLEEGWGEEPQCLRCRTDGWYFERALAVSAFEGPMAELIREFKFRGHTEVASFGGRQMASVLRNKRVEGYFDVLVPVPLHIQRLRQRGFNQSHLLAKEVGRATGIAVAHRALKRHRWTMPQPGLDIKARQENVRGAFEAPRPSQIKNQRILLIDDVFTTGHTVNECARTLRAKGAGTVDVLTLARVV